MSCKSSKLKATRSFIAHSGKTIEDTANMHETNIVEHKIPYKKLPGDFFLSTVIWSQEQLQVLSRKCIEFAEFSSIQDCNVNV